MKAFLKNELFCHLYHFDGTDYRQFDREEFTDIQIVEESQDWDSYLDCSETNCLLMPLIPGLAIHIIGLIAILKGSNLTAEAEFFRSTCSQRERGKIKTSKRDKEIIKQYEAIHKTSPTISDTKIVQLIRKDPKNNGLILPSKGTIADVISDHYSPLIRSGHEKCEKHKNELSEEIMLGIDYADKNKIDGKFPPISSKCDDDISKYIYFRYYKIIHSIWKDGEPKPNKEQVSNYIIETSNINISKFYYRPPNSVKRIIENPKKKAT